MSVCVTLSNVIYPRGCIDQAISAYAMFCSVEIGEETAVGCSIYIATLQNANVDEARVVPEFLNYLLELSVESHLGKLTAIEEQSNS